jgi:hypothetical protein
LGGKSFNYLGYFTLDLTGDGGQVLTFTATAVPEPATYVIVGAGMLLLSLRRQLIGRIA